MRFAWRWGPRGSTALQKPARRRGVDYVGQTVAAGGRLMGFGHRIYKVRDPRADVLSRAAEQLAVDPQRADFLRRAKAIEQVTLRVLEELKPGRNLRTNVEFYTAMLLECLGLPSELFTPTFAVAG